MDNKLKNIGCVVGLLLLLLPGLFCFITIKLMALETCYTENEWFKYQFLTPDELKQAPRVTNDYRITITARDGSAARVETIEFYGSQDTQMLERYLVSLGYYPARDHFSRKTWYSPDNERSARVIAREDNSVILMIFDEGAPLFVREEREKALGQSVEQRQKEKSSPVGPEPGSVRHR
ncbi:hypothetical protein [Mixta hanseatica]|uniref:Uncharacterized protein n=1 Tax=Mixta hanseatica TaxID=2872648 RepID=A0ABY4RD48_9GAMM|nr:hypothetical protein [Mixta hanseatica]UQY44686.1 hypothetical protein K6958_03030 [Mixta hanseatica]